MIRSMRSLKNEFSKIRYLSTTEYESSTSSICKYIDIELVRRNELLRLGAITRGSPGYTYVWLDTAPSSAV